MGGGVVLMAELQAGGFWGYGNCTTIQVGALVLLFGHQNSFAVVPGDKPAAGAPIGVVDSTGNSSGNHLHFGVWDMRIGFWIDPMPFLAGAIT
ncbi:MAG TPA: M23 family metallopeptidase [Chloroflexota bacterium]|nr:M23 family metallopeptidase [Chloroflexota bacterium]